MNVEFMYNGKHTYIYIYFVKRTHYQSKLHANEQNLNRTEIELYTFQKMYLVLNIQRRTKFTFCTFHSDIYEMPYIQKQ